MIQKLFPTLIYQADLNKDQTTQAKKKYNLELAKEAKQFQKIDDLGREWCLKNYPGGYTSYGSLADLHRHSSTFEELEKMIRVHVLKFGRKLDFEIRPQHLKISSLWINIMPPQVTHTMHIHPLSVISGTYYVQTPPHCSSLKFEDPRFVQFMASPPRKEKARLENQRFFSIQPKAGSIVLFESWMRHEVPPNASDQERISISFNYDWRG